MRWKIFIPLALALTVFALAGNHFWMNYTDRAYATALTGESIQQVTMEHDVMSITVAEGYRVSDVISVLEANADSAVWSRVRDIRMEPKSEHLLPVKITRQVDLIAAQAQATKEYYTASLLLEELAVEYDLTAETLLWGNWLFMELNSDSGAYYGRVQLNKGGAAID
ncbi:MAG: hypothetical protein FH749_03285 [Firmicutes bacterium]|nr:hypothetical protein [Bacillota bacterium]